MSEVKGEEGSTEQNEPTVVEAVAAVEVPTSSPPTPAPSDKGEVEQDDVAAQVEKQPQPQQEAEAEAEKKTEEAGLERLPSPALVMAEGPDDLPIPTAIDPESPSAQQQKTPVVEAVKPVEEDADLFADPEPVALAQTAVVEPQQPVEATKEPVQATEEPVEAKEEPVEVKAEEEPAVEPAASAESASDSSEPVVAEASAEPKEDSMGLKFARRQYFSDDDEIDDELFSAERGLYSLSALAGARSATELISSLEGGNDEQLESIRYDAITPTFSRHDDDDDDDDERVHKTGAIVIKVPTSAQGFHHTSEKLPDLQRTATPEPYAEITIPTLGPGKDDTKGEDNARINDSIDAMMRRHRPDPNMIGRMRFDDEELYDDDDEDYDPDDYAGDFQKDMAMDIGEDEDEDEDLDDKPKPKQQQDRKRQQPESKANPMFVTSLNTSLTNAERGVVTYDDDDLKKRQAEEGGIKEIALDALESAQEFAGQAFGQGGTYAEKAGVMVAKALKVDDKIQNHSMYRWIGFGIVGAVILIILLILGLTLGGSKEAAA